MHRRLMLRWRWPLFTAVVFIAFQLQAIDYGNKINDLPHVRDFEVTRDMIAGSALERNTIVGAGAGESIDRWMMRFKIYSIEADEHVNIMALARIKQGQGQFDPHFYQYGGAWLYPLGAWYLVLSKLGVVSVAPLTTYLEQPDLMDAVYMWGRILVTLAVAGASLLLFAACRRFTSTTDSTLCMMLFLAAPGTIMFSQVMKPHWYALLWVCAALFILTRCPSGLPWRAKDNWGLGICLGMAVGSVLTFGLFAVLCWLALLGFVLRLQAPAKTLLSVPAIALLVYLISNPFAFLNWPGFVAEASVVQSWFTHEIRVDSIFYYMKNSLLPNFGVGTVTLILCAGLYCAISTPRRPIIWLAAAAACVVILIALLTASIATWHTNTRYLAYLLPSGILFLCMVPLRGKRVALGLSVVLVLLQSAPLALAYHDENNLRHSTRYLAAQWIAENIAMGTPFCLGTKTAAPYDTPPINFSNYLIGDPSCQFVVAVEREPDSLEDDAGLEVERRFRPRYSPKQFPLVFSHINPQITIYRRVQIN